MAAGVPCSPFRSATPHSTASRARRFPLQMIFNCSIFDGNHCSILDGSGHTVNPNLDSNQEIKISPYLEFIIDSYFSLCDEEKELVRQCIGLLYEGIELFNTNRSVSLLSIVSSIEGMANLDLKIYGNGERLGPTDRFLRYLKTYVAGRSEQKFRGFYKRRCDITHEGRLFLSDLDLYGDIQKQDEDWRLRLEILQAARLAMYNWMRRGQQEG